MSADGVAFDSARGHWVLAIAVLGSGLAFLDGTVVNVALPEIGRDLVRGRGYALRAADGEVPDSL